MSVLVGRRLSRRSFLKAAAASGAAAVGLAGIATGATRGPGSPSVPIAQQGSGDPIGDLGGALAYDIERIFPFVADEIRYEPYAGVLRGARGTLAARAGSSADQAALLAALLEASLVSYRFAVGRLDGQAVDGIAASSASDSESVRDAVFNALAGSLPGAPPAAPPALAPEAQALVDAAAVSEERVLGWARDQLTGTLSTIESALGSVGISLPTGFTEMPRREIDQHVWVQAALGTEWVDLDPTLPAKGVGQRLAPAIESLDALPEDLYHRVERAVIAETAAATGASTETVLKVSERADLLAGLPITFVNASPAGVERLAQVVTPVAGVTSYVPTLIVGEEAFAGRAIRFGQAEGLADDILGGAEDILGGGTPEETTAEWLELSIISPDREPVVARRAVFDRFGPAARASGQLDPATLVPAQEVMLGEGCRREILPALASTWLAVSVGLPHLKAPVMESTDDDVGGPAVFAQGQHLFRELGDLVLGLPLGTRSFADAPNITGYTIGPRLGPGGDQLVELVMDIWHRSRGTVPVTDIAVAAPPATAAGVLDHVVERFLMGDALDRPADAPSPAASVGAVLDAARQEGVGLRVLHDSGDAAALEYHPDARALLEADLVDGWLAVAPERPVLLGGEERVGWWLIDPVSGQAVDRLDDGRGAEGIEYQATLTPGNWPRRPPARSWPEIVSSSASPSSPSSSPPTWVRSRSTGERPGWPSRRERGAGAGAAGNHPGNRCLGAFP